MSRNSVAAQKQQGSAIIIAIFVIIIISLLGASLASLQRDNAQSTSYEVYAARAYLSAYSASEIALTELFPLVPTSASSAVPSCSNVSSSAILPSSDVGYHGCSATITCTELTSSLLATRYKVTSTAVCENTEIVTRRKITVEAVSL